MSVASAASSAILARIQAAAKAEAPKAEAPKAEAPKAEAPKAEAPKAKASKARARNGTGNNNFKGKTSPTGAVTCSSTGSQE